MESDFQNYTCKNQSFLIKKFSRLSLGQPSVKNFNISGPSECSYEGFKWF